MGVVREAGTPIEDGARVVSVLVEPRPGHSDEEVVAALKQQGAQDIDILSPGFISALVTPAAASLLSAIADVHKKVVKQTLSGFQRRG